jgi:hypothetical protein
VPLCCCLLLQCLSGALYRGDFARVMRAVGFSQWWVVTSRAIDVGDPAVAASTRGITFYSETVRACKVAGLEDAPEDYGQYAVYNGSIPSFPHAFTLGLGSVFITDQRTRVDGNTARILSTTRYASAFRVSTAGPHRGPFRASGGVSPAVWASGEGSSGVACCGTPAAGGCEASPEESSTSSSCCQPAATIPGESVGSSCCQPSSACDSSQSSKCC